MGAQEHDGGLMADGMGFGIARSAAQADCRVCFDDTHARAVARAKLGMACGHDQAVQLGRADPPWSAGLRPGPWHAPGVWGAASFVRSRRRP